jgi:acyl-coenzyme A thioesterase PaaI-like protein
MVLCRRTGDYCTVIGQAFQDQMRDNYCWGCGADNPAGPHLKSYWDGELAVAQWTPSDEFAAGPRHFLNGGIIATLLDCHGVGTAVADAYHRERREIGTDPEIWHATVSLSVDYLRPTPLYAAVKLSARVVTHEDNGTSVECVLGVGGKDRARAMVRTTRVPGAWRHGSKN